MNENIGLIPYPTNIEVLSGSDFKEVWKQIQKIRSQLKTRTKRQLYIRSAFFNRQKVFLSFFWQHLADKKSRKVKTQRLRYFPCTLQLIRKSRNNPITKENPNKRSELLHRFAGLSKIRSYSLFK